MSTSNQPDNRVLEQAVPPPQTVCAQFGDCSSFGTVRKATGLEMNMFTRMNYFSTKLISLTDNKDNWVFEVYSSMPITGPVMPASLVKRSYRRTQGTPKITFWMNKPQMVTGKLAIQVLSYLPSHADLEFASDLKDNCLIWDLSLTDNISVDLTFFQRLAARRPYFRPDDMRMDGGFRLRMTIVNPIIVGSIFPDVLCIHAFVSYGNDLELSKPRSYLNSEIGNDQL